MLPWAEIHQTLHSQFSIQLYCDKIVDNAAKLGESPPFKAPRHENKQKDNSSHNKLKFTFFESKLLRHPLHRCKDWPLQADQA